MHLSLTTGRRRRNAEQRRDQVAGAPRRRSSASPAGSLSASARLAVPPWPTRRSPTWRCRYCGATTNISAALPNLPMVTRTAQDIPGDPINVGLIGDKRDVLCAMQAADWYPADPVTARSSIEIIGSVLLDRPYARAPVSPLFYLGRPEDLAFEKPVGDSADRRHHVRFWKVLDQGQEKRPVWLGSATFDRGVGVSHYTGAITHHISPDVDAERGLLASDLEAAEDGGGQISGDGHRRRRLPGETAAAIPISPMAKCGSCGW